MEISKLLAELDSIVPELAGAHQAGEPLPRIPTDASSDVGRIAARFNRLLDVLDDSREVIETLQIQIHEHMRLEEQLRQARDEADEVAWRKLLAIVATARELTEDEHKQCAQGVESGPRNNGLGSKIALPKATADVANTPVAEPHRLSVSDLAPVDRPVTRRLHVLVADDHPFNRRHALRILEQMGHSVVVVDGGLEAVSASREQTFDMIFLDIEMPEMDGLEAAATIRGSLPRAGAKRVPIVAMTAHGTEEERASGQAAGIDDFVSKPLEPEELAGAIDRALEAAASGSHMRPALASIHRLAPSDAAFVRELAQAFLDDTAMHLAGFQAAIDRHDVPLAHRSALSLKVLLASVSAESLSEIAQHAAAAAAAGDLSVLRNLAAPLADGLAEVRFGLEEDLRAFAS